MDHSELRSQEINTIDQKINQLVKHSQMEEDYNSGKFVDKKVQTEIEKQKQRLVNMIKQKVDQKQKVLAQQSQNSYYLRPYTNFSPMSTSAVIFKKLSMDKVFPDSVQAKQVQDYFRSSAIQFKKKSISQKKSLTTKNSIDFDHFMTSRQNTQNQDYSEFNFKNSFYLN